jgi:hypothetical protein
MGLFNPMGWSTQTSDGPELRFGTAIGSANSNFGWSSFGKPARLPAAVNSHSCFAECRPASPPALLLVCVHGACPLARTSKDLAGARVRSIREHCGSRGWGRDCRPPKAPGSLCAATGLGFFYLFFVQTPLDLSLVTFSFYLRPAGSCTHSVFFCF